MDSKILLLWTPLGPKKVPVFMFVVSSFHGLIGKYNYGVGPSQDTAHNNVFIQQGLTVSFSVSSQMTRQDLKPKFTQLLKRSSLERTLIFPVKLLVRASLLNG